LSDRVEAIAPVEPRALKERLWEILEVGLRDQRQAWDLQPDGTYVQRRPAPDATDEERNGSQATLMARTLSRSRSGRVGSSRRSQRRWAELSIRALALALACFGAISTALPASGSPAWHFSCCSAACPGRSSG